MRLATVIAAFLLTLTLIGCGSPPGEIKGKVFYGDKPVKVGEVIVFGSDGIPKNAKIQRDGTYAIKDVATGTAKIAVLSINPAEVPSTDRAKPAVVDPVDAENWFPIANAYNDPGTSGLTATIKGKTTDHDIKMTPK